MEISEGTDRDVSDIVNLLKISLGESLMPKSAQYWNWKHVQNPFGASPVLLCRLNGELIGVRAFMRWQWKHGEQVYDAVRAVDTATHPNHQGKGVFKKLTLACVDSCIRRGDHFVFNTPNQQSMPGYLKMGWELAGRLPVHIKVHRPFSMIYKLMGGSSSGVEVQNDSTGYFLKHPGLPVLLNGALIHNVNMITKPSIQYLTWRYQDVPVARYLAVGDEHASKLNSVLFGRTKETRIGREFRITDYFVAADASPERLMQQLASHKREWGIDYITVAGLSESAKKINAGLGFRVKGPNVTIRPLALTDMKPLKNFNNWSPSLGDLELF